MGSNSKNRNASRYETLMDLGRVWEKYGKSRDEQNKACFVILDYFYEKRVEKVFPNWRWHSSASWVTGQIQT